MAVLTRLVVLNLLIFIGASLAMDWSSLSCTANDVRIEGSGVVLNEPCYCPEGGTFTANIQFSIINANSATRSCFTLQLCQAITLNGHTIPGGFIALNLTQQGRTTSTYAVIFIRHVLPLAYGGAATIYNYPCRSGNVCFGAQSSLPDGTFPRGASCPNGQCCDTIGWETSANQPCVPLTGMTSDPPGGQCRHQSICIAGRSTTVSCTSNCAPCSGTASTLRVCAVDALATPLSNFSLVNNVTGASAGPLQSADYSTPSSCATFSVMMDSPNQKFVGTIVDNGGCAVSSAPFSVQTDIPCNGMNCGHGHCVCTTLTCACDPGWITGPAGNCSQKCGNGIVEGSEQCDSNSICCQNCRFAPSGTVCGPNSANGCGESLCDTNGTCRLSPIANAQGKPASCPLSTQPCKQALCSGLTCALFNSVELTSCGTGKLCEAFVCLNGTCTRTPANTGSTCNYPSTPTGPCTRAVCKNADCVTQPDVSKDNSVCSSPASMCESYVCKTGVCSRISVNESVVCGASSNVCQQKICQTGTCTLVPFNDGLKCAASENGDCKRHYCASGQCGTTLQPTGTVCSDSTANGFNFCTDQATCTAAGECNKNPVVCDPPSCQGATVTCNPNNGFCFENAANCCGNGIVDVGEQCDDPTNPCCADNCFWKTVGTACQGTNDCTEDTCQQKGDGSVQCQRAPVLDETPCATVVPRSQCHETLCFAGVCTSVGFPNADAVPCDYTGIVPECGRSICVDGSCAVTPRPSIQNKPCTTYDGTPTECQQPLCLGLACELSSAPLENTPCHGLPAGSCQQPVCASGVCTYDFSDFPPGTTCPDLLGSDCLYPACDGAGTCMLFSADYTNKACDRPSNPQCNVAVCDGLGSCILRPINIGLGCDLGADGGPCLRGLCDGDGLCSPQPVPDGTLCSDDDGCTTEQCLSGACVSTPVLCNEPLGPCSAALGTCTSLSATNYSCDYTGLGDGATCIPLVTTAPGCNYSCVGSAAIAECIETCPVARSSSSGNSGIIIGATLGAAMAVALAAAAYLVKRQKKKPKENIPAAQLGAVENAGAGNNPLYEQPANVGSNPLYGGNSV